MDVNAVIECTSDDVFEQRFDLCFNYWPGANGRVLEDLPKTYTCTN